ncbi:hypothetical protein LABOLPEG_00004 [Pseudomonas phage phi 21A]|nr:hypothetical protein LABOLPEG_00004 [Pseudomonas phage phi 21A]
MCEPVSIMAATGMAMGVAGGAMSAQSQAKAEGAQEDARRAGLHEAASQMYRERADANLEIQDKRDLAREQLSETNIVALKNRGVVSAAIGESGLSGNSMDRIQRDVENEASREKMRILDNYDRDYATIFQNQVAGYENTKAVYRGSRAGIRTSKVAQALNVVSGGIQGASMGASLGEQYKSSTTPKKK